MPTLNWIGKSAVVKHHKDVPFRLLEPVAELSLSSIHPSTSSGRTDEIDTVRAECVEAHSGNLIVQGDNLHALKSLLPRYAGQVKCIYIDPPYNTGNEGWVYNDNVNSPEIRRWLGEVVGKEGETLDRHDRWLCMMYPRLLLLKQFLRDDGAIFISIDDNEVATLRLLMDEIFGAGNFVGDIIWQHSVQAKGYSGILSLHHNHTLVYGRSAFRLNDLTRTEEHNVNYTNPDNDPRGHWRSGDVRNALIRPNLMYDIQTPSGKIIKHPPKGWRFSKETFKQELAEGKIIYSKDETRLIRKIYLADQTGRVPESIWFASEAGTTREATAEVAEILGGKGDFETPKPTRLIQRILQIATDKDSLILDSFAGSGTTAHAVLKQNAEDGGSRRFILVEMDAGIAQTVTAERVKRVAEGYRKGKSTLTPAPLPEGEGKDWVAGLGGGFQFCRLSAEPLFDADGQVRSDVTFAQLAEFVWFVETGTGLQINSPFPFKGKAGMGMGEVVNEVKPQPLPNPPLEGAGTVHLSPLLGVHNGTAIYLLYNGILKDRGDLGGNVLNKRTLAVLPPHDGARVIYGARSRFDRSKLARLGIEFKQLPYELSIKSWA